MMVLGFNLKGFRFVALEGKDKVFPPSRFIYTKFCTLPLKDFCQRADGHKYFLHASILGDEWSTSGPNGIF